MQRTTLTFILIVIVAFTPVLADELTTDEAFVHEFLNRLKAYRDSGDTHANFDFEFCRDKPYFNNGQQPTRCRVRYGEGAINPFDALNWMLIHLEDFQNVKVKDKEKQIYSLILPGALKLSQGGEVATLDAQIEAQLYEKEGQPWYVRLEASAPDRRWAIQKIWIVYIWNYYTYFDKYGEEIQYWVPVEILIRQREKNGGVRTTLLEQWTLQRIVGVGDGGIVVTGAMPQIQTP